MSRFSKRLSSSTSQASSTNTSPAPENLDGLGGEKVWKDTDAVQNKAQEHLMNPCSLSRRPASSRDKRRRRKRMSVSSTEGDKNTSTAETGDGAAQRLFGRVAAIHWVDGGNGGLAGGSFPTNMCSLARLAALPNLAIRVHGSPYQWGNNCRPFLAFEADAFLDSVEGFRQAISMRNGFEEFAPSPPSSAVNGSGSRDAEYLRDVDAGSRVAHDTDGHAGSSACDVKRVVYFESEQPSLDIHFRVLRELNTD